MFPFEADPINTAESDTIIKEESQVEHWMQIQKVERRQRKQSLKLQRCSVADGPAVS